VRSLGPEGVKKGLTTTLPVALGLLQSTGQIRRMPLNGRLDQQRYRYVAWNCPVEGSFTELARRYFRWIGPATLGEFQTFSGLGVKAAKTAVESLNLIDAGEDRLMLPEDLDRFQNFEAPKRPQYALVGSLDGIGLLGSGLKSLIARENLQSELAEVGGHAILDRGELIGRWDFDTGTGAIVWALFGAKADKALETAIREMEAFVRDDLGDAPIGSLESPRSRAPRIEILRKAAHA
jgi:hypothetical protein